MTGIRAATPQDYPAIAEVHNAAYPETCSRIDPRNLQHRDQCYAPKHRSRRYVLEVDDRIVGAAHSRIMMTLYHPRRFALSLVVHPDYQGRGLGKALYDHVRSRLQREDPLSLRALCREDMTASLRFLKKRHFREHSRYLESSLDLAGFDLSQYADVEVRVRERGIEIRTLEELRLEPGWDRKLHELHAHTESDIPTPEPLTALALEEFKTLVLKSPRLVPELYLVALDGERYVGLSSLACDQIETEQLHTWLTGVHRDYRRKGIALALKTRGIACAKAKGFRRIRTWNDSTNRVMLSINERLGFVNYPPWIVFLRTLKSESE